MNVGKYRGQECVCVCVSGLDILWVVRVNVQLIFRSRKIFFLSLKKPSPGSY